MKRGVSDSANYTLVKFPNGNVEKHGPGWLSRDSTHDGPITIVTKIPPPLEKQFDLGATITNIFAIVSSALTILGLATKL